MSELRSGVRKGRTGLVPQNHNQQSKPPAAVGDGNQRSRTILESKRLKEKEEQEKIEGSFTLTITREKLERGRVHVPALFDDHHLHTYTPLVQLRLANTEQVWTVEAKKATHRPEMNLSTGWRTFMRDNDIRIGDQCEFQIVDSGPPCVLRVLLMRPMAYST
ncbi:hypothetical protein LINPERHAP2_LOCUS23048 [Linum perenne]